MDSRKREDNTGPKPTWDQDLKLYKDHFCKSKKKMATRIEKLGKRYEQAVNRAARSWHRRNTVNKPERFYQSRAGAIGDLPSPGDNYVIWRLLVVME